MAQPLSPVRTFGQTAWETAARCATRDAWTTLAKRCEPFDFPDVTGRRTRQTKSHRNESPARVTRRSISAGNRWGRARCACDVRWRRIVPVRKELHNESHKNERESTSAHSTHFGSGHLIPAFRGIGRIV